MELYRCRPCQKDFQESGLVDVRRCPVCNGPLLSHARLRDHQRLAQLALHRLRSQSALTMGTSAVVMLAMQAVLSLLQPVEVADFFNSFTLVVAGATVPAAWLWWKTAQRFWMLTGAVLLQTSAALFFFVVMGVAESLGGIPLRWALVAAVLPMGGALMAWHHFRAYAQVLKLEQGKGRGSLLPEGRADQAR